MALPTLPTPACGAASVDLGFEHCSRSRRIAIASTGCVGSDLTAVECRREWIRWISALPSQPAAANPQEDPDRETHPPTRGQPRDGCRYAPAPGDLPHRWLSEYASRGRISTAVRVCTATLMQHSSPRALTCTFAARARPAPLTPPGNRRHSRWPSVGSACRVDTHVRPGPLPMSDSRYSTPD